MKFRAFRHNYHEADLVEFASRDREIIIDVVLHPCFNASQQPVRVSLDGVENVDEVAAFLASLPKPQAPGAPIAEITALQYTGSGPNWVLLELVRRKISDPCDIVIRAKQVHES